MTAKAARQDRLKQAVTLANTVKTVLVATASGDGWPHLAVAGKIEALPHGRVAVDEWFCPETVSNLEKNPRISLAVWHPVSDTGYQLMGEVEQVEESAFLNGYLPEGEGARPLPQTRRRLTGRGISLRRGSATSLPRTSSLSTSRYERVGRAVPRTRPSFTSGKLLLFSLSEMTAPGSTR